MSKNVVARKWRNANVRKRRNYFVSRQLKKNVSGHCKGKSKLVRRGRRGKQKRRNKERHRNS